eukprot:11054302-Alexandrium_andersonii.AAC.1
MVAAGVLELQRARQEQADPDLADAAFEAVAVEPDVPVPPAADGVFEAIPASPPSAPSPGVFEQVPHEGEAFAPEPLIDLHALDVPPVHHILDTATNGLADVMPLYKDNVRKMVTVCRVLRKRGHRTKLLERCFASA